VADSDEPLTEATVSLYLRRLVQAEIDRSFKLGLSGGRGDTRHGQASFSAEPVNGRAVLKPLRRN
jgi:hypothetical protein